ncbi:Protein CBR-CDC-25.3 [Caenorhabditis briggsae]|uniref:M-phase inducer phosphatase n=2 Tax=Caenorhabditis briggsae TaxID=6238 RepID=A8X600_CAEBR|nr:Protein CBR-CDC-25.3 [Caenorhabditis briggsae]ULT79348.1 hypothetical protein L3Y34_010168 [Caenorhabditis briggsae]CAP28061.1 Protein CBR-CDC-25.3 [Caenorhabditis briggsae]
MPGDISYDICVIDENNIQETNVVELERLTEYESSEAQLSPSEEEATSTCSSTSKRDSLNGGYIPNNEEKQAQMAKQKLLTRKSHSTSEIETSGAHLQVKYQLETTETRCSAVYRKISPQVLIRTMLEMTEEEFAKKYSLYDCRFSYEFNGGSIKGAKNLDDPDKARETFFDEDGNRKSDTTPIFFCEYSQKRGPRMADTLRSTDRFLHPEMYPQCAYEEIYVLNGGYKNFFSCARALSVSNKLCDPDNYAAMDDPKFAEEFESQQLYKKLTKRILSKPSKSKTTSLRKTASSSSCFFKQRLV